MPENKIPSFEDTADTKIPSFEDTADTKIPSFEDTAVDAEKKKDETVPNGSGNALTNSLQNAGSNLSSTLNSPSLPSPSGSGENPEYTAYKEASKPQANVDQLKQQVKEHILGDESKLN